MRNRLNKESRIHEKCIEDKNYVKRNIIEYVEHEKLYNNNIKKIMIFPIKKDPKCKFIKIENLKSNQLNFTLMKSYAWLQNFINN